MTAAGRRTAYGVDYDAVAPIYDDSPFRQKQADPALAAFLAERPAGAVRILDVGCGTGNQLVADLAIPGLTERGQLLGVDPFEGMLRVARGKSPRVQWVRGDGTDLPLATGSFDYVTNQFSYHHIASPEQMLREVFRVLRAGGRFVLTNIAPRDMAGAQLYRWFPDAYEPDLRAHPAPETLREMASSVGFVNVEASVSTTAWETDLTAVARSFSRKGGDSRLNALPDDVFERCLAALQAAASASDGTCVQDVAALLTLRADRP